MQNNPQVVFERLFGDGSTDAERAARRKQSLSLLDSVAAEAGVLQRKLPTSDRARLDQYLTDVREIERRIQKAGDSLNDDLDIPAAPTGVPKDVEEHIKLMYDLQVLAWQAEITRVSTFLMSKELSNAVYPKSGIRDAFHMLSHHSGVQSNIDRFTVLNRYHYGLFAYFLNKLKTTPDGDGTLLDHSLVLYGSGMSDGNGHNHTDLPIVLVGGASNRLAGGRHIVNAAAHADGEPAAVDAGYAGDSVGEVRRQLRPRLALENLTLRLQSNESSFLRPAKGGAIKHCPSEAEPTCSSVRGAASLAPCPTTPCSRGWSSP